MNTRIERKHFINMYLYISLSRSAHIICRMLILYSRTYVKIAGQVEKGIVWRKKSFSYPSAPDREIINRHKHITTCADIYYNNNIYLGYIIKVTQKHTHTHHSHKIWAGRGFELICSHKHTNDI